MPVRLEMGELMKKIAGIVAVWVLGLAVACSAFNVGYALLVPTPPTSIPPMNVGAPFSLQLSATGGLAPYVWSCPAPCGAPPGISISSAGLISGTPTSAGSYLPVFSVTDSEPTPQTKTIQVDPHVYPAKHGFSVSGTLTISGLDGGGTPDLIRQGGPAEIYGTGFASNDSLTVVCNTTTLCSKPQPISFVYASGTTLDLVWPYYTVNGGTLPYDSAGYTVTVTSADGTASASIDPETPDPRLLPIDKNSRKHKTHTVKDVP